MIDPCNRNRLDYRSRFQVDITIYLKSRVGVANGSTGIAPFLNESSRCPHLNRPKQHRHEPLWLYGHPIRR